MSAKPPLLSLLRSCADASLSCGKAGYKLSFLLFAAQLRRVLLHVKPSQERYLIWFICFFLLPRLTLNLPIFLVLVTDLLISQPARCGDVQNGSRVTSETVPHKTPGVGKLLAQIIVHTSFGKDILNKGMIRAGWKETQAAVQWNRGKPVVSIPSGCATMKEETMVCFSSSARGFRPHSLPCFLGSLSVPLAPYQDFLATRRSNDEERSSIHIHPQQNGTFCKSKPTARCIQLRYSSPLAPLPP